MSVSRRIRVYSICYNLIGVYLASCHLNRVHLARYYLSRFHLARLFFTNPPLVFPFHRLKPGDGNWLIVTPQPFIILKDQGVFKPIGIVPLGKVRSGMGTT